MVMNLRRKKPFLLLALIFAIPLLVLICVTSGDTCYDQTGLEWYEKYQNNDVCDSLCQGTPAVKKIYTINTFVQGEQTATNNLNPFDLNTRRRYVRCGWLGTTKRIFFAAACLLVLALFLELLLTSYLKWFLLMNIIYLFTIGMTIVAAIYIIRDIHRTDCGNLNESPVVTNNGNPNGNLVGCNRSIFVVSFILMICVIPLLAAQFLYNCIRRKIMNEEDPRYANIPQSKKAADQRAAAGVPVADHAVADHAVVDNRIQ